MRQNPVWILIPALLLASVPAHAQQTQPGQYAQGAGTWPNFAIYKPADVAPVDLADSPRIDRLIREGKLHLSLADAVALALENNLDIAVARYGPQEADAEILRTRGGGVTQGINTAVGAASTGQSAAGPGSGGQVTGLSGTAFPGAGTAGGGGGAVANLDPVFTSSIGWNHFTNPQSSDFVAGTSSVVVDTSRQQMGYSQGFLTGTSFQLNFTNTGSENNIDRNNFNPSLNSNLGLTVSQRLTQGFGRGLNSINISVAKNNREISDLAFEEQVMTTVNSVVGLYWDLVGFAAQVEARRLDLELSEKLLRDNKRKVELGLLAGIEVMRSEAQVAGSRNQLTQAIRTFRE
ncbi:MAG: TolC family protein [Acidobacteria bacterium]|nr:TolC family protein [Acidobacteriota bacterium]